MESTTPEQLKKNEAKENEAQNESKPEAQEDEAEKQLRLQQIMKERQEGLAILKSPTYLIGGKYRMLNKLGGGSFGEIYAGIQMDDNEKIAVKIVRFLKLLFIQLFKEPANTSHPQLQYESRVYKALKGGGNFYKSVLFVLITY